MKLKSLTLALLSSFLFFQNHAESSAHTTYTRDIFSNQERYDEFAPFIDTVLRQIPSEVLYQAVRQQLDMKTIFTDEQLYAELLKIVPSLQLKFSLYHKLKALSYQKNVLCAQAEQLLGSGPYESCIEIGSPATYSVALKKSINITGTLYSINEREQYVDYLQSFSCNPLKKFTGYDVFIPLNDYAPLESSAIPDNSVELIVCFIGLHHIPTEKLDSFISSLHRILKPGGTLLLREHNAHQEILPLVYAAHTIFNAVMSNVPLAEEVNEYRNFQPLGYWVDLLQNHGFKAGQERLLQAGDPTLNTMMPFTKNPGNKNEERTALSLKLQKNIPGYKRRAYQGDMTAPEWINVDASQDYSDFIKHTPFFEFPYWEYVKLYWKVFGESYKLARKKESAASVLFSSYFLMNAFIGCTMTTEYAVKSLISAPVRWMYSGQEDQFIHLIVSGTPQEINALDERMITILDHYPESVLTVIKIPRYKQLVGLMKKMSTSPNLIIHEIAGQEEIQVRVQYPVNRPLPPSTTYTHQYSWTLPAHPEHTYSIITSPCSSLLTNLALWQQSHVEVLLIHDF